MREQRYKFWNTEKKEMYGPYTLEDLMLGATLVDVLSCLSLDHDGCKALQYTTLKDKNGTEIYHEDILRITEEGEEPVEGIVKWTDIGWSVNGGWLSDFNEHAEVVRSKHEPKKGKRC